MHVFNTLLKPHTSFLIGRKGTGKSTIFQRVQHEIRKNDTSTSVYLDIKTIFESSQVDEDALKSLSGIEISLSGDQIRRLFLFRAFLTSIVQELKAELKRRAEATFWNRVKEGLSQSLEELFEGLDSVLEDIQKDRFESILGVKSIKIETGHGQKQSDSTEDSLSANISQNPGLKLQDKTVSNAEVSESQRHSYSDLLIRTFKPKEILLKIKELLTLFGIRHLFVFVDDFSELPEDAMCVVVDSLIAPFNNWSDEFIMGQKQIIGMPFVWQTNCAEIF